jgi:hypothetical protein
MTQEIEITRMMERFGLTRLQAEGTLRQRQKALALTAERNALSNYWQQIDATGTRIALTEIRRLPSIGNRHRVGG